MRDIAQASDVSITAVSRVLNKDPAARVAPETRKRILETARDLGYRPNFAGRALKLARTNMVALIVPDVTNVNELLGGVEEAALEKDYMVLLGRSETMQPGGEAIDRLIGEARVDGLLVQLSEHAPRESIQRLLEYNTPIVLVNSYQDGHIGSVTLADQHGAEIATEHLLSLGHRRIALMGGSDLSYSAARREAGFYKAMSAADIGVDPDCVVRVGYSAADGHAGLRRLFELADPPTAVVVANVDAAIGALAESRALGIRVPEDLSLIAFNDSWAAEHAYPALTVVKMPLRELGRRAFDLIQTRIKGGQPRDLVVNSPKPRLVKRGSTARPR